MSTPIPHDVFAEARTQLESLAGAGVFEARKTDALNTAIRVMRELSGAARQLTTKPAPGTEASKNPAVDHHHQLISVDLAMVRLFGSGVIGQVHGQAHKLREECAGLQRELDRVNGLLQTALGDVAAGDAELDALRAKS
jgi:hypothetical protein